jgi:hypothetical protein
MGVRVETYGSATSETVQYSATEGTASGTLSTEASAIALSVTSQTSETPPETTPSATGSAGGATSGCSGGKVLPAKVAVKDAVTRAAVTDAVIAVVGGSITAESEETGADGAPDGTYQFDGGGTITISAPGYAPYTLAGVTSGYDGAACGLPFRAASFVTVELARVSAGFGDGGA